MKHKVNRLHFIAVVNAIAMRLLVGGLAHDVPPPMPDCRRWVA